MRDQVKYYATSLGVHLGLLALILGLTAQAVKYTPPITLDFTLSSCPIPEQPPEKPKQPVAAPKQPVSAPPPVPVKQEQARPEPPPTPVVTQYAAPTPTAPAASQPVADHVPRGPATPAPAPVVASATAVAQGGEGRMSPEKDQQKYLKEHFTYIRDLINNRLTYPQVARRMGWSGRVVLVFVVAQDGSVRSLRVKESSGYAALDNSAMETVKKVAPFPRPPVAAELVMPVQFNLE